MSISEKLFSIVGICYITGLALVLVLYPPLRQFTYLLPLSFLGVVVNVVLLFVVFKDILKRRFTPSYYKFIWIVVIFLFIPAIVIYLPIYGFKKR